jgi:hypothetical protein
VPFLNEIKGIWIIPTEVAGFGASLQKGFIDNGYAAQVLNLSNNTFSYNYLRLESRLARLLMLLHEMGDGRNKTVKFVISLISLPCRICFIFFNFKKGTLIISLFGQSVLRGLDLKWARAMGACVITVFLGSDSRPPYINGAVINSQKNVTLGKVRLLTKKVARSVKRAERLSDLVVCSPSTAHFLETNFVNWFHIGMPSGKTDLSSIAQSDGKGEYVFRIAHAPSNPLCKGTEEIKRVISELQQEGFRIEFHLLQSESNTKVLETIKKMDLVVDELYSDTFMGGLGAEAAASGVPFLTFGYAEEEMETWTQVPSEVLSGYANPRLLKDRIIWAINDFDGLKELAVAQNNFQTKYWAREDVAVRYIQLASGVFPESWIYSPSDVDYIWGAGVPKDVLSLSLYDYITKSGIKNLYVRRDAPLLQSFLREYNRFKSTQ